MLGDMVMLGESSCSYFFVVMQAAISFLFGRRDRSVWMFVRSSTWWEDVVLNSFGVSRKFCSAENLGPGPIFQKKIVPSGTNFPEKKGRC